MKTDSYNRLRDLVSKIDDMSKSADMFSEMMESIKKNGGKVKLLVNTCDKDYTTELGPKTSEAVFKEVLLSYYILAKEAKSEINSIIDDAIGEVG